MTDIFKFITAFMLVLWCSVSFSGVTVSPDADIRKEPAGIDESLSMSRAVRSSLLPRLRVDASPYEAELARLNKKAGGYKALINQLNKTIAEAETDVERRLVSQRLRSVQSEASGVYKRQDVYSKMVSAVKMVNKDGFFSDKEGALSRLNAFLSVNGRDTTAVYLRGYVLYDLKRYSQASGDLRKAIDSGKNDRHTLYHMAMSLFYQGKYTEGLGYFDKTIEKDSGYAVAYYYRGLSQFRLNRFPQATKDYNAAVFLDKSLAKPY